jgi:hypothetical protein
LIENIWELLPVLIAENTLKECRRYKILSIESLSLDVKYEFNSDNQRMYSGKNGTVLLAEGEV